MNIQQVLCRVVSTVCALAVVVPCLWAEPAPWTMKDVEAAYANKNFAELGDHVLDVPASARSATWTDALRDTIAYQMTQIEPGARVLINLDTLELLKPALAGDSLSYDFRVKVAKFLRLHTQRHANALEWFRYAHDRDASKTNALCDDEDLRMGLVDGLQLPAHETTLIAHAKYFAELCYTQLAPLLKETLVTGGDYAFINLCPLLRTKGAIEGNMIKLRCDELAPL